MGKKKPIDWMGRWYTVAKERGVNVIATIARKDMATGDTDWFHFSHENFDGAGGMGYWQRNRGYNLPELPKARITDRPPWWKRPYILWKGLHNLKSRIIPWKEDNPAENPDPHEMEIIVLEPDQTLKLNQKAKSEKLSQNSVLLSIVNNTILPQLIDGDCIGGWVFPVNMRGNVNLPDDTMNCSSGILVETHPQTTARTIHQKIKEQLINKFHWSNWWVYNVGKIIGMAGMRYLSKRSGDNSFFYGTFSNMGEWPVPGSEPDDLHNPDEIYFVAAPGTRNYPVSVGLITWHGTLAMTLKVHPIVLSDRLKVKEFAAQIKQQILDYISQ